MVGGLDYVRELQEQGFPMTTPEPQWPLAAGVRPAHVGDDGRTNVTLRERRLAIVQVTARKGREAALASKLMSAFRLTLPDANQTSRAGALKAIWIGPQTWLVTGPFSETDNLADRVLAAATDAASVVDQTFGKVVLRLSGAPARDVLAKGCRIDLHPRVFGPGRAAVTPLAQIAGVVLQVDAAPTFDLIVPSTLAEAFRDWILASAAEFGCEIRSASD